MQILNKKRRGPAARATTAKARQTNPPQLMTAGSGATPARRCDYCGGWETPHEIRVCDEERNFFSRLVEQEGSLVPTPAHYAYTRISTR